MMTKRYNTLIAVVAGLMLAGHAQAAFMIEWQDGDTHPFDGWVSEAQKSGDGLTENVAGGAYPNDSIGSRTALRMDPDVGSPSSPLTDVHFTTAANLIGDLSDTGDGGPWSIQFDFYANADGAGAGAPQGLGFYFQAADNAVWYYNIDTSFITDGWGAYTVALDWNANSYAGGWYGYTDNTWSTPILTEAAFDADVASVARIGFLLTYSDNNTTQDWGVDDFGLSVPEPETYLVLGMALLSVAIVFRKRISDSLAEARAMMHA